MNIRLTLIAVMLALNSYAATPVPIEWGDYAEGDVSSKQGNSPLIWNNIFTWNGDSTGILNGSDTLKSAWMALGAFPNLAAPRPTIKRLGDHNPEVFRLFARLKVAGAGDSVRFAEMRFEQARDTTLSSFWNADSSNRFALDGSYGTNNYNQHWTAEDIQTSADSVSRIYNLDIRTNLWTRFWIITTAIDTLNASDCDLWGEKP
jgi:hypothetical protein